MNVLALLWTSLAELANFNTTREEEPVLTAPRFSILNLDERRLTPALALYSMQGGYCLAH
jgi:hypothetical protein